MRYDRATMNRLAVIAKTMSVAPPKKDETRDLKKVLEDRKKKKKRRKVDEETPDKTSEAGEEETKEKLDEIEPKAKLSAR